MPQTITVKQCPDGHEPLSCDILLFSASAAVGKSTFAKALSATSGVPLLDLSKVLVSTDSLRGIISAEMGDMAPGNFQHGQFSLVIDALDEGRIVSGDNNFYEFLCTTIQFLQECPGAKSTGPKLLLFGRPEAIDIVRLILESEAWEIPMADLTIDYFEEAAATALVMECARAGKRGPEHITKNEEPIRKAIGVFFEDISTAIGVKSSDLWHNPEGRSFAGYAPVLAALGALVAETSNYIRLQETSPSGAWQVLEGVTRQVLDREKEKFRDALAEKGVQIPSAAYDSTDQLDILAAHLSGRPFTSSTRLTFVSPEQSAAYREAVKSHIEDHAFLRGGTIVNDVFGALIVAHAMVKGTELSGKLGPDRLAAYGRQPFIWRFVRDRVSADTLIDGEAVGYILSSLWSDAGLVHAAVAIETADDEIAQLTVRAGDKKVDVKLIPPLRLRGDVRNLDIRTPAGEVVFAGWPGGSAPTIRFLGDARILANVVSFDVRRLNVGSIGTRASCHLCATRSVGDQQLVVTVQEGSRLTVAGAFESRYPWADAAEVVRSAPVDNPLWNLISDCQQRLQNVKSLVVFPNYGLPEENRMEWARRHGDLLSRLLCALVECGLATASGIESKERTKIRVTPTVTWEELSQAIEDPGSASGPIRQLLQKLTTI
ncbi:MAG: hypothetical protein WCB27_07250 [Thermoguttaceae bacterium]